MLKLIETLINEHGSSTILKERLGLIKDEYTALERKCQDLQLENDTIKQDNRDCQQQRQALETELNALKQKLVCDHCGSPDIVRVGSTPNPRLRVFGDKDAVYRCNDCEQHSTFVQ